jgi:hypothetical protein
MKNLLTFLFLFTAFISNAQRSMFGKHNKYVKREAPSSNTINVIEAPSNGGSLVLNLDARNVNSLAQTGNPSTWYDLSGNNNHATLYGSLAYGTGNGGALNFPGGNANYAQARSAVYLPEVLLPFNPGFTPFKCLIGIES